MAILNSYVGLPEGCCWITSKWTYRRKGSSRYKGRRCKRLKSMYYTVVLDDVHMFFLKWRYPQSSSILMGYSIMNYPFLNSGRNAQTPYVRERKHVESHVWPPAGNILPSCGWRAQFRFTFLHGYFQQQWLLTNDTPLPRPRHFCSIHWHFDTPGHISPSRSVAHHSEEKQNALNEASCLVGLGQRNGEVRNKNEATAIKIGTLW